MGVSLVMTNTENGEKVFKSLNVESIQTIQSETTQNSLSKPANISGMRLQAFQILNKLGYEPAMKRFGEVNIRGYLKNEVRKIINKV